MDMFVLGLGKENQFELLEEENHCRYHDPIEQFPAKIDQLFGALNRVLKSAYLYS
jgi:hypothetical protein